MFVLLASVGFLTAPVAPGGSLALPEAVAVARCVAGRAEPHRRPERLGALRRLQRRAEIACRRPWPTEPRGAAAEFVALQFLIAEARLGPALPRGVLDAMAADRAACHAAGPLPAAWLSELGPHPRLAVVATKLPLLYRDLVACPGVAGTLVAALSLRDRPARVVADDPVSAPAECVPDADETRIRLTQQFSQPARRAEAAPAVIFESFNAHNTAAGRALDAAAAAGALGREDYVWSYVALEHLAAANVQRVYLEKNAELRAAGVATEPAYWWVGGVDVFLPPDPASGGRWRVRTDGYPYAAFGRSHDWTRLNAAADAADFWAAAVLLDRLRLPERPADSSADPAADPAATGTVAADPAEAEYVREWDEFIAYYGPTSPAYRVHAALPRAVRSALAATPGGTELPGILTAARTALRPAFAP